MLFHFPLPSAGCVLNSCSICIYHGHFPCKRKWQVVNWAVFWLLTLRREFCIVRDTVKPLFKVRYCSKKRLGSKKEAVECSDLFYYNKCFQCLLLILFLNMFWELYLFLAFSSYFCLWNCLLKIQPLFLTLLPLKWNSRLCEFFLPVFSLCCHLISIDNKIIPTRMFVVHHHYLILFPIYMSQHFMEKGISQFAVHLFIISMYIRSTECIMRCV